ncbi:MAG: hypothetical protein WDN69_30395 [Aliidongia sp.]
MTGRSGSAMLPATFEERGAVVPFTTPALSLARVRRDQRQRMILLMPNFGGTEGGFRRALELGRRSHLHVDPRPGAA